MDIDNKNFSSKKSDADQKVEDAIAEYQNSGDIQVLLKEDIKESAKGSQPFGDKDLGDVIASGDSVKIEEKIKGMSNFSDKNYCNDNFSNLKSNLSFLKENFGAKEDLEQTKKELEELDSNKQKEYLEAKQRLAEEYVDDDKKGSETKTTETLEVKKTGFSFSADLKNLRNSLSNFANNGLMFKVSYKCKGELKSKYCSFPNFASVEKWFNDTHKDCQLIKIEIFDEKNK